MKSWERAEALVKRRFQRRGYAVLRRGWPDFLCVHSRSGRVVAVEVKAGTSVASLEQRALHSALRRIGLRTLVVRLPKLLTRPARRSVTVKFTSGELGLLTRVAKYKGLPVATLIRKISVSEAEKFLRRRAIKVAA